MSVTPPPLRPVDLAAQQVPGQLALRGRVVVYTLRAVHEGRERTDLWRVDLDGAPRPLTASPGADTHPRISPDGRRVAFLRAGADGVAQPHLLELDTDQPARPLATLPRGATDLDWAPDGTWLAVTAPDAVSPVEVAGPPGESPTALVLTDLGWRRDGEPGGLHRYPTHVHRLPVDGDSGPRRLTSGAWSASRPRVGADGVHFLADLGPDADLDPSPQVHRVRPDGGVETLTALAGGVSRYHLTATGVRVLGQDLRHARDAQPPRWIDVRPGREPQPLVAPKGWPGRLGDESDVFDWQVEADDAATIGSLSADGRTWPVDLDTGAALVTDQPVLTGAVAADGPRAVAVLALGTGAQAPDVYELTPDGPRRLTHHGDWLTAYRAPEWRRLEVDGPGGVITVHLLRPAGATGPLPTVLLVHGGPTGQWGVAAPLEAVLLAGAGFQVAMPNIRGSIDRGAEWVSPLYGAWGRVDADDCLAVCDHLVTTGLADERRLGVSGLSYGGFLVQWLIGTTDRFAAAVAENGVTNQIAAWALCEDGLSYNRAAGLGEPLGPDGVARLWAASPLRSVARVRTPLLMLQGADDRTCPAADNEQFFVALRAQRRTVEYVLYPEESHLMQGSGRLDRRIDRHRRTVAWFERHLV